MQQCFHLQLRQVHTNTHVHATAKAKMLARVARYIELIRVAEYALVAVGTGKQHHHAAAFFYLVSGNSGIRAGMPREAAYRRRQSNRLVHRTVDKLGLLF